MTTFCFKPLVLRFGEKHPQLLYSQIPVYLIRLTNAKAYASDWTVLQ